MLFIPFFVPKKLKTYLADAKIIYHLKKDFYNGEI